MRLRASLPILTLLKASVTPAIFLTPRSPRGTSLEEHLLDIPGHPLVALSRAPLRTRPPGRGEPRAARSCPPGSGGYVDSVRCALLAWGGGELPVARSEMLAHLLLEHLFEDGLHAPAHSGLYIQPAVVMLKIVVFRGQVPPSSLETHNLPDTI